MATIEQRAKEWCIKEYGMYLRRETNAYIKGAYEQSNSVIEQACDWLIEMENGTEIVDVRAFVEDFRKAMHGLI